MDLILIAGESGQEKELHRKSLVGACLQACKTDGSVKSNLYELSGATVGILHSQTSLVCNMGRDETAQSITLLVGASQAGLAAIGKSPDDQLRQLGSDGACLKIVISEAGNKVVIYNDGVGFIEGFYYRSSQGDLYFSTRFDLLVGVIPEFSFDVIPVLEYCAFLHPLGEASLVKGVELLPAGSELSFSKTPALFKLTSQKLLLPKESTNSASKENLVSDFSSMWSSVFKRLVDRSGSSIFMGLSGGLDSRSIAGGFHTQGARPTCITYGTRSNYEVRVAEKVARTYGLPHRVLPIDGVDSLKNLRPHSHYLSSAQTLFELYELWFADQYTGMSGSFISGVSGDVFWGSDSAFGFNYGEKLLEKLFQRYEKEIEAIFPYLSFEDLEKLKELMRSRIDESIKPYSNIEDGQISTYWNLNQRQRRWGLSLGTAMRQMGLVFENPFFDKEFLEFTTSLPSEARRNGSLWIEIHKKVFTETASIRRANDYCRPTDFSNILYYSGDRSSLEELKSITRSNPLAGLLRAYSHFIDMPVASFAKKYQLNGLKKWAISRCDLFPKDMMYWDNSQFRSALIKVLEDAFTGSTLEFADHLSLQRMIGDLRKGVLPSYRVVGKLVTLALLNSEWQKVRSAVYPNG